MPVDFIHQNHHNDSVLEYVSFSIYESSSRVLFYRSPHLIKNNEDLRMSSYSEFSMKGVIVLSVLKYLSSNAVTLLQKNVNIFKQFLISFALISSK